MIIDRHRDRLLGIFLPDYVLVEEGFDFGRAGKLEVSVSSPISGEETRMS